MGLYNVAYRPVDQHNSPMLLIDNYDSFTFNLVQYFHELGEDVTVLRNDAFVVDLLDEPHSKSVISSSAGGAYRDTGHEKDRLSIRPPFDKLRTTYSRLRFPEQLQPKRVCISPGPGTPECAGKTLDVIKAFAGHVPILGVCLGHQAIAQHFGASVTHAPEPVHGKTSLVTHNGSGLLAGLPNPLRVCRYHSLAVKEDTLPPSLRVTARSDDGVVMAIEHRELPIWGVQFHPEAILTEHGHDLLRNFLRLSA